MTTTTKKLTIALSDSSPVTINLKSWPIIADAKNHDGEVESQANRMWTIKVRRHADGRTIVYGCYDTHFTHERCKHAGYLIETGEGEEAVIRAIRRVAGAIGDNELADAVIADLPAHDVDSEDDEDLNVAIHALEVIVLAAEFLRNGTPIHPGSDIAEEILKLAK